jgi:single-strand DNA-binding protein
VNTQILGTARLGADPELRFTPSGRAVCDLRIAFSSSTRVKDSNPAEYKYSPPIWVTATLWGPMAENAAEVLRRGDEVLAGGQLEMEEFTRKDGDKGEKLVLKNAEVAPSIRRGAVLTRGEPVSRSDNRPAPQHRTPDPVGARPGLADPFA